MLKKILKIILSLIYFIRIIFRIKLNNENFYFGIGGLGDLILLSSTVRKLDYKPALFFITDNDQLIEQTSPFLKKLFSTVFIFPKKYFSNSKYINLFFTNSHRCLGTGVTPKNLDYVSEWYNCNPFEKYKVTKKPWWISGVNLNPKKKVTVWQIAVEVDTKYKNKSRNADADWIQARFREAEKNILIGTKDEIKIAREIFFKDKKVTVCSDLKRSIRLIMLCNKFYGGDSWGKSLSLILGKNTEVFFPKIIGKPEELYGKGITHDPGNDVFLHEDWFR